MSLRRSERPTFFFPSTVISARSPHFQLHITLVSGQCTSISPGVFSGYPKRPREVPPRLPNTSLSALLEIPLFTPTSLTHSHIVSANPLFPYPQGSRSCMELQRLLSFDFSLFHWRASMALVFHSQRFHLRPCFISSALFRYPLCTMYTPCFLRFHFPRHCDLQCLGHANRPPVH